MFYNVGFCRNKIDIYHEQKKKLFLAKIDRTRWGMCCPIGLTVPIDIMIVLLRRTEGATIEHLVAATGWQKHSARGAMSGTLKKKQNLTIGSEKVGGIRIYRIASDAAATTTEATA